MNTKELILILFIPIMIVLMISSIKVFRKLYTQGKLSNFNYTFIVLIAIFVPVLGYFISRLMRTQR